MVLAFPVTRPLLDPRGVNSFWADALGFSIGLGVWAIVYFTKRRQDQDFWRAFHKIGIFAANAFLILVLIPVAIILLVLGAVGGTKSVSLSPGEVLRIDLTD